MGRDSDVRSRCGVGCACPVAHGLFRCALGRARHRAPDTSFSGARVPALAALRGSGARRAADRAPPRRCRSRSGAAWGAALGEQICAQHSSGLARHREAAPLPRHIARLLRTLSSIWGRPRNARMPDAPGELLRDTCDMLVQRAPSAARQRVRVLVVDDNTGFRDSLVRSWIPMSSSWWAKRATGPRPWS